MIARHCLLLLLSCTLASCTSTIQTDAGPTAKKITEAIIAAQLAQQAGRADEAIERLHRIDETIQQGSPGQFCNQDSLQGLLAEHLRLCTYLQDKGNYAEATGIFHSAIALETRCPQWRAAPGPASKAFSGMLRSERADENRPHFKAPARTREPAKDRARRKAVVTKLVQSLDEYNKLRDGAFGDIQAGKFGAAEQKLKQAEQVCHDSFGESSVELAQTLALRADVLQMQGQAKESTELRRRVLSIYDLSPQRRREVLKAASDLAEALDKQQQHAEAEKLHCRALSLLQKNARGDETLVLGRAARNLFLLGRLEDGAAVEKKFRSVALRIPRSNFATEYLIEFGKFYQGAKRYHDAIACYELAMQDQARLTPNSTTELKLTLYKCRLQTGDLAGCDATAKQLLKANLSQSQKLALAGLINLLAAAYKSTSQPRQTRAIELNRMALELCEQTRGENSSEAISSLVQLSDSLLGAGDRKASSAALQEAANRCRESTDRADLDYYRQQIKLRLRTESKSTAPEKR